MSNKRWIQLDCGQTVRVDSCYYTRTYGGLLDGVPDQEYNDRLVAAAATKMERLWGFRKTHVIPPVITMTGRAAEGSSGYPSLPPELWIVWLESSWTADSAFDGTELVVAWFQEEEHDRPMFETILEWVRPIPWKELADGFQY